MTEEQINRIAELVVEKLSAKQEEYDKAFQKDMQSIIEESKTEDVSFGMTTPQDMIKDQSGPTQPHGQTSTGTNADSP